MEIDSNSNIISVYREMYQRNGDLLSLQYGGSIAHKQNTSHTFEFMTSIKRHYNNSFTDQEKQVKFKLYYFILIFKASY